MKTSEIFEACIPLIDSGSSRFICHALYLVEHGDDWVSAWAKDLYTPGVDIIRDAMGCADTLTDTSFVIAGMMADIFDVPFGEIRLKDIKTLRVEWLKSLVKEYQLKGD